MQNVTLSLLGERRFVDGLSRVARPIERNANYHTILGNRLDKFFSRYGIASVDKLVSPDDALAVFDRSMVNGRIAIQMMPPRAAVAWGKTRNNLREFEFLRRLLARHNLDTNIFNVSHHRLVLNEQMTGLTLTSTLRNLFHGYLCDHWPFSPAAVFQLINYVHAYICWYASFRKTPTLPRVLVLANDHSPNQVACTAVAQDLKVPTVYIQHAEVTQSFPPLAFDVSVLRNQASLDVYESVGPIAGTAHIVSRDETAFLPQGFAEAVASEVVVGVYLTAQVLWEGVRQVVQNLQRNKAVDAVFVKPHPSQPGNVLRAELDGVEIQQEFVAKPHVAVVANSSVVVELLHAGNVVLQNYAMDAVPRDYYGFSRRGIAPEVSLDDLSEQFWNRFVPDEQWRKAYQMYDPWAGDDYLENEVQLARELSNYFPAVTESKETTRVKQDDPTTLVDRSLVAADAEQLCRNTLRLAPNTVIDYVNNPQRFAPRQWNSETDSLDFSGALERIFADRVTNSYELFGMTRRIKSVNCELVYTSKRRDIELTGRLTQCAELDAMTAYVAGKDLDPAQRWRYDLPYLMLLLRLGEEERIYSLFSKLPPIPVRKLGINPRIALVKWLRDNHQAQLALNLYPAKFYLGLAAFQQLKLTVLTATPAMYERQIWTHQEIEQRFFDLAHPGAKKDLSAIFLAMYNRVRARMTLMDVRWSQPQRQNFYDLIESALREKRPFSLVRLSDREAYMFAEEGRYFTVADVENCERHWWRAQLSQSKRSQLTLLMRHASKSADVLGIPCIYRLLRQTDVKTKSLLTSLQGRGLAEVAHHVAHSPESEQIFTEEKANVPLFTDPAVVLRLCGFAQRVVLVASASEQEAQRIFRGAAQLCYIAIPTHSRTMSNHKYGDSKKTLPEVYGTIRIQISDTVRPGDLVLVAAGVIGKIFVEDAKQAGGVALDVGTCLDDWVEAGIHSLT